MEKAIKIYYTNGSELIIDLADITEYQINKFMDSIENFNFNSGAMILGDFIINTMFILYIELSYDD